MGGVLDRSDGVGPGHGEDGRLRSGAKSICSLHLEETKRGAVRHT